MAQSWVHQNTNRLRIRRYIEYLIMDRLATVIALMAHHTDYIVRFEAEVDLVYPRRDDQLLLKFHLFLYILPASMASRASWVPHSPIMMWSVR